MSDVLTLLCDAPDCGWKENVGLDAIVTQIDRPCPRCGANVLTRDDATLMLSAIAAALAMGAELTTPDDTEPDETSSRLSIHPHAGKVEMVFKP